MQTPKKLYAHLVEELARVIWNIETACTLATRAGFPTAQLPSAKIPLEFWTHVIEDAHNGACKGGALALVEEAVKAYPENKIFNMYLAEARASAGDSTGERPRARIEIDVRHPRLRTPVATWMNWKLQKTLGILVFALGVAATFYGADIGGSWATTPGMPVILLASGGYLFWHANRRQARIWNPNSFKLSPRVPSDLIGREGKVEDLEAAIRQAPVIFVVGKSGAGKSTLIRAGLLPRQQYTHMYFPIYMSTWSGGWIDGPKEHLSWALRDALAAVQVDSRHLLRLPEDAFDKKDWSFSEAVATLTTMRERGCVEPLIIFDQFEQYVIPHRGNLQQSPTGTLTLHAQLVAQNEFWREMCRLAEASLLRLIFITQDDMSFVLPSFGGPSAVTYWVDWIDTDSVVSVQRTA